MGTIKYENLDIVCRFGGFHTLNEITTSIVFTGGFVDLGSRNFGGTWKFWCLRGEKSVLGGHDFLRWDFESFLQGTFS